MSGEHPNPGRIETLGERIFADDQSICVTTNCGTRDQDQAGRVATTGQKTGPPLGRSQWPLTHGMDLGFQP